MARWKKRGAEKPGFEYALGGRASKASPRQVTREIASMSARKNSRNRWLHVAGFAFLAVTTVGSTGRTQEKFQKLAAGQIRAKLAGVGMTDNGDGRDLTQANGTVMRT